MIGLFAVSAGGCGGCDDSSLVCDTNGENCQICDGYGCHAADPNDNIDVPGDKTASGGGSETPACDASTTACPCQTSVECQDGLSCVSGVCIAGCDFTYQCGAGNICINGGCAPGCDAAVPCDKGYTCNKGACVPDPKNPECSTQAPCSESATCVNGFCTTPCSTSAECGPGGICDGGTHTCIPDVSAKPACSETVTCAGDGQVCQADGYCHYLCDLTETCKLIDSRFVACDKSVCKTAEEYEPQCSLAKPCPSGKDCVSNKCL